MSLKDYFHNFNIHYITYPLLVVAFLASLYWYGGYKQRQADKAQARADSIAVVAKKAIAAKHTADSIFADSMVKVNAKIKAADKAVVIAKQDRDSTLSVLVENTTKLAVDNKILRQDLSDFIVQDSILLAKKDSTIADRDDKILFMGKKMHSDSLRYDDLAKLNTSTNLLLAKANAEAHPGLLKRIIKNWDIEAATVVVCHFGKC